MMDAKKALVRACYDRIADAFAIENRQRPTAYPDDARREQAWFERFVATLPPAARVLDVGCGSGEPYLVALAARGLRPVGLDLSHEQLVRARVACPAAALVEADMTDAPFADGSFDGMFAMHSIWHVPRREHAALFVRLRRCLRAGAVALLTMAALPAHRFNDGPGLFTELCGAPIFYDAHRADVPLALLADAGFDVLDADPPAAEAAERVLIVLLRAR